MIMIGERSTKFGIAVIIVERPEIWANVREVARVAGAIITDETPERFVVLLQPAEEEQALTLLELQTLLPVVPDS